MDQMTGNRRRRRASAHLTRSETVERQTVRWLKLTVLVGMAAMAFMVRQMYPDGAEAARAFLAGEGEYAETFLALEGAAEQGVSYIKYVAQQAGQAVTQLLEMAGLG